MLAIKKRVAKVGRRPIFALNDGEALMNSITLHLTVPLIEDIWHSADYEQVLNICSNLIDKLSELKHYK